MKKRERERQTLRLPGGLKRRLEECAVQNGRSVNAEIVQRLLASLNGYRRL